MKNEKLLLWLFSSVLGIGWGIFAHSYWLLSNPRLTGRFLAIAIAGIVFAASIFHFLESTAKTHHRAHREHRA